MNLRSYISVVALAVVLSAVSFATERGATLRKPSPTEQAAHSPCPEWLRTLRARRDNPRLEGQLRFFEGGVWVSAQATQRRT